MHHAPADGRSMLRLGVRYVQDIGTERGIPRRAALGRGEDLLGQLYVGVAPTVLPARWRRRTGRLLPSWASSAQETMRLVPRAQVGAATMEPRAGGAAHAAIIAFRQPQVGKWGPDLGSWQGGSSTQVAGNPARSPRPGHDGAGVGCPPRPGPRANKKARVPASTQASCATLRVAAGLVRQACG